MYSVTTKFGVVMIFTSSPPYVGRGGLSRSDSRLASRGSARDNGDETRGTSETRDSHYESGKHKIVAIKKL